MIDQRTPPHSSLRERFTQYRTIIGSIAIVAFFIGMLCLAVLSQSRIADSPPDGPSDASLIGTVVPAPPGPAPYVGGPVAPPRPTPPAAAPPLGEIPTRHTVVSGETLSGIALSYGVPVERIAAENRLVDPDLIRSGQHLIIGAAEPGTEVIEPGTTLTSFAQVLGCDVADLLELNPQISDPNVIYAGAGLRVPIT